MSELCGCYHGVYPSRQYLPQLELAVHTTVFSNTSRTTLKQKYVNASKEAIKEMSYKFPLYDGVSVVGFTCTIGDRVLNGVVKERVEAKAEYDAAVARGETAGLLEESRFAGDVFSTSLGNVGAGEAVIVEITFIGELKHDAEVDGVRFMLPTIISPRYGSGDDEPTGVNVNPKGISFTLDAEVPEGSVITAIRSPSHPIAVTVGTTSTAPNDAPSLRRASAALSLDSVVLGKDLIVQVVSTAVGDPFAAVERHPTLDTQALMVTLVPKFSLPAEKPEIVFICDRSGSMYDSINDLKEALRIFLKSLPVGVKFNICSFGTDFSFLWPKSRTYDQASLAEASKHIDTFDANFGGTEMYKPVEETFKRRFKDMSLEVFLLTDGEIWDQEKLFELINNNVAKAKGAIRVFTLGVGIGASTSLIEGVARAGNGFAQTTAPGEKMDKKVVRMLKGSLFPHISDYTLEVKYNNTTNDSDDDFEIVEKIADSLVISSETSTLCGDSAPSDSAKTAETVTPKPSTRSKSPVKKIISLFNKGLKDDSTDLTSNDKFKKDRFADLPNIPAPRYLQTPTEIPALYPFNRTTVYVLMDDNTRVPSSVVLRGTAKAGPLELEIPVTVLSEKAATIHQLASRREMKELEEGRGWLAVAKDKDGKLIKTKYESSFTDLTQKEAVRLGTTFQVAGKYTSLVAIESTSAKDIAMGGTSSATPTSSEDNYGGPPLLALPKPMAAASLKLKKKSASPNVFGGGRARFGRAAPPPPACPAPMMMAAPCAPPPPGGAAVAAYAAAPIAASYSLSPARRRSSSGGAPLSLDVAEVAAGGMVLKVEDIKETVIEETVIDESESETNYRGAGPAQKPADPLQELTRMQSFVGSWSWSPALERVLGLGPAQAALPAGIPAQASADAGHNDVLATACAVAYFRKKLLADKEAWEMMADKAIDWLNEQVGDASALVTAAETLF